MPRLLRNALIGAAALSFRALFYRDFEIFGLFVGLGALCGVLYTFVEPSVRNSKGLHYVPWLLCAYLVIGGIVLVGVLKHDDMTVEMISSPFGVMFLVIVGAIGAYAAARTLEDK